MASTVHHARTPVRAERVTRTDVWATEALLLLMVLIWGINFSVVKFGASQLAPLAFNGARVALAAAVLLAVTAAARVSWPSRRDALALLGLGVLGNGFYQVLFIEGIARTRAGTAALVLAACPAFIALMGRARRTERVSRVGWSGIGLQIAGIVLVVAGSAAAVQGESRLAGNLLILASAVVWSLFTVMLKPYTHRVHNFALSALTMTGGAIPLLVFSRPAIAATPWSSLPAGTWGAVAYSGIAALVIAYLCWYRGVRVIGPTRTASYANLQPLVALVVAWLALGEAPTIWQAFGGAGIMTGLLLTRRK